MRAFSRLDISATQIRGSEDINAEQDEPPLLKRQVLVLGSALTLLVSDFFHPVDSLTI
jgi:hypothetical protein